MRAFRATMVLSITIAALLFAGCGKDVESPAPSEKPEANTGLSGKVAEGRRVVGKTLIGDIGRSDKIAFQVDTSPDARHVVYVSVRKDRELRITGIDLSEGFLPLEYNHLGGDPGFFSGDEKEMHFDFIWKREGANCAVVDGKIVFEAPLIHDLYITRYGEHYIVGYHNETVNRDNAFIDGTNYDIRLGGGPVLFHGSGPGYLVAGDNVESGITTIIKNGEVIAEYPSGEHLYSVEGSFDDSGEHCVYALTYILGGEPARRSVLFYNKNKITEFNIGSGLVTVYEAVDVYMNPRGKVFAFCNNLGDGQSFMTVARYEGAYNELWASDIHDYVDPLLWSDDGQHYAFIAHDSPYEEEYMLLYYDGDIVGTYKRVAFMDFLPGSEKIHYFGFTGKTAHYYTYPGGAIGIGYTQIGEPAISADGKHVVFKAGIENEDGTISWFVVVDGAIHGQYKYIGSRHYYTDVEGAQERGSFTRYEDDPPFVRVPAFKNGGWFADPVLIGDNNTVVFTIGPENRKRYVVGHRVSKEYDRVSHPTADPSGRHFIYVAQAGEGEFLVTESVGGKFEGKESEMFDEIATHPVWDSPTKFHYIAREGDKIYLVEEEIVEE